MTTQAQDILAELLRPLPYDQFFDEFAGRKLLHHHAAERTDRAAICGPDPKSSILDMYDEFSPKLTCHSGSAKLPPPQARRVASQQEFEALVREYHKVDYTVRIPDANSG